MPPLSGNLQADLLVVAIFLRPHYRARWSPPRLLDAKFPQDRKPMGNAGDKFQE